MGHSEDIFDIVDENDCVTGSAPRSVVHSQRLRHRAVHILLKNNAEEYFLQKRSPLKDKNPNRWDSSCSGHVDSGEDYDIAAVRELQEELGVCVALSRLSKVMKLEAQRETGMEFVWVYTGVHEGPFVLCPEEISDGRFWQREEVEQAMIFAPQDFSGAFRFVWHQLRVAQAL
jgi:isopentenyl-diphosphate Delta-isomerase